MGRYLDRQSGTARASATPSVATSPYPDVQGRNVSGYQSPYRGRYRTFKEEEEKFLQSEEGQKLVEEIQKQAEEQLQQETDRLSGIQTSAQERVRRTAEATPLERDMFRTEQATSTFQADLAELGYTPEEAQEFDVIDLDALEQFRAEQEQYRQQFGTAQTTEQLPQGESTTFGEKVKRALKGLYEWTLKPTDTLVPFADKDIPLEEQQFKIRTFGKSTSVLVDAVSGTLEGLTAATLMVAAEANALLQSAATDKEYKDINLQFSQDPDTVFGDLDRWGLNARNLGLEGEELNQIRPLLQRGIDRGMDLYEESPDTPIKNSAILTWDVVALPVLDLWLGADLLKFAARPLISKQVTRTLGNITAKEVAPGVYEAGEGAGRQTVRVASDALQLQTSYQVMGLTRGEIAGLGKLTDEEVSTLIARKMRERMTAILGGQVDEAAEAAGAKLAPQPTPQAMMDELAALRAEGSITPRQEQELIRLQNAVMTATGISLKNGGVVGIPRMLQIAREGALIVGQPLNSLNDIRNALERASRLRARAAGESRIQPGLTIDDVTGGGGGRKSVKPGDAEKIDPVVKKAQEDPTYEGVDFVYDPRTNTLLIKNGAAEQAWNNVSDEAKAALIAVARQAEVNLGVQWGNVEPGVVPGIDEFDPILKGFAPTDNTINKMLADAEAEINANKEAVLKADEAYIADGLAPDDPILKAFAESGIDQKLLLQKLDEIANTTTNRQAANIISRQLLNTPIQANLQAAAPIRKSALSAESPIQNAIISDPTGLVANLADIARRVPTAAEFVRRYSFFADASRAPDVPNRGTGIFANIGTVKDRIRDFDAAGTLNRDDIRQIIRAEIPSELVEMTAASRLQRLTTAMEDLSLEDIGKLTAKGDEGDRVRSLLYERNLALSMLTSDQVKSPELTLQVLRAAEQKPNTPLFMLTDEGNLVLLSPNPATEETIAAAKMGGVSTIPGYIVDVSGALDDFRALLRDENMTVKDFALMARKLEPTLPSGKKASKPISKEMRIEAGLASDRLTRLGTSIENSAVIPTKLLRQPFPSDKPVLYNGTLPREQWEIPELKVIGEGTARIVFEVGPDSVLKVAKTELGRVQNLMSYNTHAWRHGLIPNQYSGGRGWIHVEKTKPLEGKPLKVFEDFVDTWRAFADAKFIESKEARVNEILEKWLAGDEQGVIDTIAYANAKDKLTIAEFDKTLFEFLNYWRSSDVALTATNKEGKPLFNWTEFSRYDVNLDIFKEDSWGIRADGTMTLTDEGSIYRQALNILKKGDDVTWRKFFTNFDEDANAGQKIKKELMDSDGHRNFGFVPVPAVDGDDDEEGYNDDIWRSLLFTAIGSLSRGKGGRRGLPKKVKPSPAQKLRQQNLPKTTPPAVQARVIGSVTDVMNNDVSKAVTGEAFGGVLPQAADAKISAQGAQMANGGKVVPPFGDAGYTFTDTNVAAAYANNGKVKNFATHMENPLVINTDQQFREVIKRASVGEVDLYPNDLKLAETNAQKLRTLIEGEGYDGVVIAMDSSKGPTGFMSTIFGHDQVVNFNKNNYKLVKSPNVPKVTITKQTRAKKLQRKIMRLQDPPASKVVIDEYKFLKKRLQLLNTAIKEGRKLGAMEARNSVRQRLNNMWEWRMEKVVRSKDLQLLRQRIMDREKILIKREMVDYADAVLPTSMGKEFTIEKGRLIKNIANLETRADLQKAFDRIDRMRNDVDKARVIKQIKKAVDRWGNSPSLSADYRKSLKELVNSIDTDKRRSDTIRRIAKMRDFLNRQIQMGEDVVVTEGMQRQLELLTLKSASQMTLSELKNFYSEMETLIQLGKTKRATYVEYQRLRKENALDRIEEAYKTGDVTPLSRKVIDRVPANLSIGDRLPAQIKFNNWWKSIYNGYLRTRLSIKPMDYFFDALEGNQVRFDGPISQIFRDGIDPPWAKFLKERQEFTDLLRNKIESLKLDGSNSERIAVYMMARRPEGYQRMRSMGITQKQIDEIKLTSAEAEWVEWADEILNDERPILAKIARDIFNKEFNVLDDMFPMIADTQGMVDENLNILERFGDIDKNVRNAIANRTKVKPGTIENRKVGAKGDIVLNAFDVMLTHVDNTIYMKNMAEQIKHLGDIANSPRFREYAGDIGQEIVKAHVDVFARKGGSQAGQLIPAISWLNRNSGPAELAWKLGAMLIQPFAINNTAAVVGPTAYSAFIEQIASRRARRYVIDNFLQVKERIGDDFAYKVKGDYGWIEAWNEKGFKGLTWNDRLTAGAGGMAAYRIELAKKGKVFSWNEVDEEAALQAQKIVRLTQASSEWKDAPSMLGSGYGLFGSREANRAVGKFQTFVMNEFEQMWNYGFRSTFSPRGTSRSRLQGTWALMAILISAMQIVAMRRGVYSFENWVTGRDNEEDRRLQDSWTSDIVQEILGKFPFMGQVMSIGVYDSEPIVAFAAPRRIIEGIFNVGTPLAEEIGLKDGDGMDDAAWRGVADLTTGVSGAFGIGGTGQVRNIFKGAIDGDIGDAIIDTNANSTNPYGPPPPADFVPPAGVYGPPPPAPGTY